MNDEDYDAQFCFPPKRLVRRCGFLTVNGVTVRVQIVSVDINKKCPKCEGPFGSIKTIGNTMIGGATMLLGGTETEGCLNDIKLDP